MDDQTLQSELQRVGREFHLLHTTQGQRTQEKNQLQQSMHALAAGAAVYAGHPHAGGGSGLQPGLFAASSLSPQPPPQQMMQHMQPPPQQMQQMQQMQQQQQFQLMQQAAGPVAGSPAGSSISSLSSGNSGAAGSSVGGSGIEKYA